MNSYDVVIVGAGPAGMACASAARNAGFSTLVLDEQPRPGGQIFRDIEVSDEKRRALLQSISEAAATAAGWSNREPTFYPEWVEKVDMSKAN